jgi:hypothetical protein
MPGVYASERVCSGEKVWRRDIVVVLTLLVAIVGAFGLLTSCLGRGDGIEREARGGGGIEREHERPSFWSAWHMDSGLCASNRFVAAGRASQSTSTIFM